MGLLGKLLKTGIHIATTPLDIIHDVATLGGAINDSGSSVVRKAERLKEDSVEIQDEVEKL